MNAFHQLALVASISSCTGVWAQGVPSFKALDSECLVATIQKCVEGYNPPNDGSALTTEGRRASCAQIYTLAPPTQCLLHAVKAEDIDRIILATQAAAKQEHDATQQALAAQEKRWRMRETKLCSLLASDIKKCPEYLQAIDTVK